MEAALEAGALDIVVYDDKSVDVITDPDEFSAVKDALTKAGFETEVGEVTFNCSTSAVLDQDTAVRMLKMVDVLEDLDDVQAVYHNADISDEIMAAIDG